jgi:hypothetical protein
VLPALVVPDELVAGERARALWLDVDVAEVDADGEEACADREEGNGGEELPGSGRGAPPHPTKWAIYIPGREPLKATAESSRGNR